MQAAIRLLSSVANKFQVKTFESSPAETILLLTLSLRAMVGAVGLVPPLVTTWSAHAEISGLVPGLLFARNGRSNRALVITVYG